MAVNVTGMSGLPTNMTGSRSAGWWGIVIVILIESTVFAALIASYFYLYTYSPEWPQGGFDPPKLLLPSINAAILFASVIPMYIGDRAMARGDRRGLALWRLAATVFLVVFLALKVYEYSDVEYRWYSNAYGSIVWTVTGFHTAHIIVLILKTIVTQSLAWAGFWRADRRSAVQGTTLYWFFVAGIWVPLFIMLYLFPYWAQ
jgi:cytochrome c oxidase subunit III